MKGALGKLHAQLEVPTLSGRITKNTSKVIFEQILKINCAFLFQSCFSQYFPRMFRQKRQIRGRLTEITFVFSFQCFDP